MSQNPAKISYFRPANSYRVSLVFCFLPSIPVSKPVQQTSYSTVVNSIGEI